VKSRLDRIFKLEENQTSVRTELLGGATTFMTMSYIIFVQPAILAAVPDSIKHAISVGIGLLIALIGLEYGGIVVDNPGTLVGLGDLASKPVLLVLGGVALTALFKLDIPGALKSGLFSVIFVFFFLDLFDTMGTLIGDIDQAGFIKNGRLPRSNRAMLADALGTVGGALLGTSTVTSYVESTAGGGVYRYFFGRAPVPYGPL